VVLEDGSLWRGSQIWSGQGMSLVSAWTSIDGISNAVGIGSKEGGVYVVDGGQQKVQTFNSEGLPGLWWEGFSDLDLNNAALSIALNGDVYMRDANGKLAVFQHPFASLESLQFQGE